MVIEEMFPLKCTADELGTFIDQSDAGFRLGRLLLGQDPAAIPAVGNDPGCHRAELVGVVPATWSTEINIYPKMTENYRNRKMAPGAELPRPSTTASTPARLTAGSGPARFPLLRWSFRCQVPWHTR